MPQTNNADLLFDGLGLDIISNCLTFYYFLHARGNFRVQRYSSKQQVEYGFHICSNIHTMVPIRDPMDHIDGVAYHSMYTRDDYVCYHSGMV